MATRTTCTVAGCDDPVYIVKRGLCIRHNARFVKYGTTDHPNPRLGEKKAHPLWLRWRQLMSRRDTTPAWRDFWQYIADVTPQPENSLKMRKLRGDEPWGATNFEWAKTPTPEEVVAYHRAYNQNNFDTLRDKHLRRTYGVSADEVAAMSDVHGGKCAICGGAESRFGNSKAVRRLAVDHDDDRRDAGLYCVRGVICHDCNVGIGALKHDVKNLKAAVVYLNRAAERFAEIDADPLENPT